jgi:hypothetical protein
MIKIPKHTLKKYRKKVLLRNGKLKRTQDLLEFFVTNCEMKLFEYPLWKELSHLHFNHKVSKGKLDSKTNKDILLLALYATYLEDLPEKILFLKKLKTVTNRPSVIRYDLKMLINALKKIELLLSNETTNASLEILLSGNSNQSEFGSIDLQDFIKDRNKQISAFLKNDRSIGRDHFKNLDLTSDYSEDDFKYFHSNSPIAIEKCIFSIVKKLTSYFCNEYSLLPKIIDLERISNLLTKELFSISGYKYQLISLETVKKMRKKGKVKS